MILFVLMVLIFADKKTNLFILSYDTIYTTFKTFHSYKMQFFIGYERFIAFASVLFLMIIIITCHLYFLFKFLFPFKKMLRASYLIQYYTISLILAFIIIVINVRVNVLNKMINDQYDSFTLHNLTSIGSKIQAETYQWYHQQRDIGNNIDIIPNELTSTAENIENTEFSKDWDGKNFKTIFKYTEYDGHTRTVNHELDIETGKARVSHQ